MTSEEPQEDRVPDHIVDSPPLRSAHRFEAYVRSVETFTTWLVVGNAAALVLVFQGVISGQIVVNSTIGLVSIAFVGGAVSGALARISAGAQWARARPAERSVLFHVGTLLSLSLLLSGIISPILLVLYTDFSLR